MKFLTYSFLAGFLFVSSTAFGEDLNQIFQKVNELAAKKSYSAALKELDWAKKELEKQNLVQIQTFLPDQLGGFTGDKFEANNILGIKNLERTYKKADTSSTVKVSLTGGSGGASNAFGGIAALGNMAALMGDQANQDTFRIAGKTATLSTDPDSKTSELTVMLESGSILKFEGDKKTDGPTLKSMAEAVKVADLDNYLKGNS
jgi:hypothetical protein